MLGFVLHTQALSQALAHEQGIGQIGSQGAQAQRDGDGLAQHGVHAPPCRAERADHDSSAFESYAKTHPMVAETFSYASDTNDEWLSGEGLLALLADGAPEHRRRRATD